MKRILIITLALIFGLSAAGLAAGTFSGRWVTDITITEPQTPVFGVSSVLTVDYRLAGWRFGSVSTLTAADGWTRQDFHADGALGAFTLTNHLRFNPAEPEFEFLRSTAAVALAGVDLETRFLVVEGGSGLRFRVGGPIDPELLPLVRATAYFGALRFDDPVAWRTINCPTLLDLVPPVELVDPTHELTFQGLDLDVRMRFFSFILDIDADFVTGFQDLTFTVPAFPLGIPGFTLGASVTFTLEPHDRKAVALTPAIALVGLGLHFVPFISVVEHAEEGGIEALRLDGLRMTWVVDPRVTFIYEWDAHTRSPHIAGSVVVGGVTTRNFQRIRIDAAMPPVTFASAFGWRHPAPGQMFPHDIDLDLSVALIPTVLSLRTGVDIRLQELHAITFGFTVDW